MPSNKTLEDGLWGFSYVITVMVISSVCFIVLPSFEEEWFDLIMMEDVITLYV